ncbi:MULTISPECIES: hypothetical protein [Paenibacillus]|uniref:Uncharacterized protein n=1 Tax=Paenibacillus albilobatus TaxID=2716884 RepID=A0A919XI37_9BACL|nr:MULTISPECIES: hypothetical protein [Paenibacillus]GIO31793.1 hypothetical protein J2TS6_29340 [Paenibacillus albilobatus]
MDRIYRPLQEYADQGISEILKSEDRDLLLQLPLSVGEYHSNWKFSQDICVKLSKHEDPAIRANAILGLAYIARTKGKLEKRVVKPIILKELRENKEYEGRVNDSIDDINLFMKWKIGKNSRDKN